MLFGEIRSESFTNNNMGLGNIWLFIEELGRANTDSQRVYAPFFDVESLLQCLFMTLNYLFGYDKKLFDHITKIITSPNSNSNCIWLNINHLSSEIVKLIVKSLM